MFQSKPFLICLGILIVFFAWNIWGLWNKMEETAKNKQVVQNQITALNQQKEKLTADINNLNTDQGKEEIFRENFGLAKAGESEIVVLDNNAATSTPPPTPSGFVGFFKNLFK
ncbi:MAG: septum formation initiator family protein [Candidatus Pacebacteria bacterium]|nr:septum formation initiator family protein [Candidatus Paceibacterota bacterium]